MLLNSYYKLRKINQKDLNDFWRRKFTLKVRFGHLLTRSKKIGKSSGRMSNFVKSFWMSGWSKVSLPTFMTLIQGLREAVHSRSSVLWDDPPLAIGTVSFHLNADHPILRQIMVGEIPSFAIVQNYRIKRYFKSLINKPWNFLPTSTDNSLSVLDLYWTLVYCTTTIFKLCSRLL